jgi:hypothetical protein
MRHWCGGRVGESIDCIPWVLQRFDCRYDDQKLLEATRTQKVQAFFDSLDDLKHAPISKHNLWLSDRWKVHCLFDLREANREGPSPRKLDCESPSVSRIISEVHV